MPQRAPSHAPTRATETLSVTVAMAVGVMMHRHSMSPDIALACLQRMAQSHGQSLEAYGQGVLDAISLLGRPSQY